MPLELETINLAIQSLPLKEALIYLVAQGITKLSVGPYLKIRETIRAKQNEKKYAFFPNKDEVLFLQEAGLNPDYQRVWHLIPNHKYLDLIRTGLLIREYNNKIENNIDSDKNKGRISIIKREISFRPGGKRLLKIVKFPSMNFFSIILSYLQDLKDHGYPEDQLEEEFNELLDDWNACSMFVEGSSEISEIVDFCKCMIVKESSRFFIMALYEGLIIKVELALKELDAENYFEENGYLKNVSKGGTRDFPKIEVKVVRKIENF